MRLSLILLLLMGTFVRARAGCKNANWWSSFNKKGLSKCDGPKYIKGFFWSNPNQRHGISRLEEAVCCDASYPFSSRYTVFVANWWHSFEKNHRWNECPKGFFLQGLFRTVGYHKLDSIQEGRCAKPEDHPYRYGHCYNDYSFRFNKKGNSECRRGYFVTGLHRGRCNDLKCIDKIKCCKMAPKPDVLDSLAAVKTRVMDKTLVSMAYLAYYLGYGWCNGCRAHWVGEDFRRNGDTWEADKSHGCKRYSTLFGRNSRINSLTIHHRLNINYAEWKFEFKRIKYAQPMIRSLRPETIDSGVINNHSPTEATRTIERTEEIVRTVTHTTSRSWKKSHELNIQVSYTPVKGLGFSVGYKFNYKTSSTTTDSNQKAQMKTIRIEETKTVPPYSSTMINLVIVKTRTTVPYTATVITHFSSELRGFLRYGGGSNYHNKYRGSERRPIFNYRFGDEQTPFYEALKYKSDTMQKPWLWADMKANYGDAQSTIDHLTSEGLYEFPLKGWFDDVMGKQMNVTWKQIPYQGPSRREIHSFKILQDKDGIIDMGTHQSIAKELPDDVAPVFPPAPEPELDPVLDEETGPELVTDDV